MFIASVIIMPLNPIFSLRRSTAFFEKETGCQMVDSRHVRCPSIIIFTPVLIAASKGLSSYFFNVLKLRSTEGSFMCESTSVSPCPGNACRRLRYRLLKCPDHFAAQGRHCLRVFSECPHAYDRVFRICVYVQNRRKYSIYPRIFRLFSYSLKSFYKSFLSLVIWFLTPNPWP